MNTLRCIGTPVGDNSCLEEIVFDFSMRTSLKGKLCSQREQIISFKKDTHIQRDSSDPALDSAFHSNMQMFDPQSDFNIGMNL